MTKIIMLIIGLLLVVLSGCSNDVLILPLDNINEVNSSGYSGNVTVVSSVTPLLFVTFEYENGILKNVN